MRTNTALLALLSCLAGVTSASAQKLPTEWRRSVDWVDKVKPGRDGKGNLVWNYGLRHGSRGHSTVWSPVWGGWQGAGAARFSGSGVVTRVGLVHMCRWDLWKVRFGITPLVYLNNNTGETFGVAISGRLKVSWTGMGKSHATDVTVTFEFFDYSQAKTTRVPYVIKKPSSSSAKESVSFDVNIPAVQVEPWDQIRWTVVAAKHSADVESWIILKDDDLRLTRTSVLARETVRRGKPKNWLAFNRGKTTRPIIGKVWDPYVSSPKGALVDLMIFGSPVNVPLPFGTLLCTPLAVLTTTPSVPFALPIPNAAGLLSVEASAQGGWLASDGSIGLANAIDIFIGDI